MFGSPRALGSDGNEGGPSEPSQPVAMTVTNNPLLLCLALGAAASCATPETSAWNLRQVHDPDGSASYTGNLRTDLEARLLGSGELGTIGGQRLPSVAEIFGIEGSVDQTEAGIDDPYQVALENVVELASFDPESDPEVRALQVETFGWLSADSAFPLVRERATLELGRLGRIVELTEPRALSADATPVGPEELKTLLGDVVTAARGGGALDEASAALTAAALDREGLRRAVRTLAILRFGGQAGGAPVRAAFGRGVVDPLGDAHDALQRELLSQSLAAALDDRNAHVRAAAVEAAVVATDNGLAGLLQGAILRGGDEVVLTRALELLRTRGIPRWDGADSPEAEEQYRLSWVGLCVGILRSIFEGPVAIRAAQALRELAPEGPNTLRAEDWIRWFDDTIDPALLRTGG